MPTEQISTPSDHLVSHLSTNSAVVRAAITHTLLWKEWRDLLEAQRREDGPALLDTHRRMAEIQDQMADALDRFKKEEKRAR